MKAHQLLQKLNSTLETKGFIVGEPIKNRGYTFISLIHPTSFTHKTPVKSVSSNAFLSALVSIEDFTTAEFGTDGVQGAASVSEGVISVKYVGSGGAYELRSLREQEIQAWVGENKLAPAVDDGDEQAVEKLATAQFGDLVGSQVTDFLFNREVSSMKLIIAENWSEKVSTDWSPPEGLYTRSAEAIANELHKASDSLKQAVSRLNFYRNRAGSNLNEADKKKMEKVLDLLHKKEW